MRKAKKIALKIFTGSNNILVLTEDIRTGVIGVDLLYESDKSKVTFADDFRALVLSVLGDSMS